jgi:predicted ATPase
MDRVFFEGIRCFATRQEVPLAPLTVLVGENSSGKSTALALIRLAWDLVQDEEGILDFNEEPFLLGAYNQILTASVQKSQTSSFVLGWQRDEGSMTGRFEPRNGQPFLKERTFEEPRHQLRWQNISAGEWHLYYQPAGEDDIDRALEAEDDFRHEHSEVFEARPFAFAPIRTRPKRTYDPIKAAVSPEGEHVPLFLASSALRNSDNWQKLLSALEAFGRESGLFTKIEVRQLGQFESDPFQVQVHIGGEAINLIDVGYGVSQILPIVVDCLRGESGGTYLLQQPEVHLHPRAQAELGSFLGVLAKEQSKRFVIETHSDYLVDRIRMDLRDKKGITPEDVALLYFERKNGEVTIHRLELDDQGNILNAPPGYRSFFLEEERRFLGG